MTSSHTTTLRLMPLYAALVAIFPLDALASAGKVLFANADVRVSANGQAVHALQRGDIVNPGDLVITGSSGFTQLNMDDGGRITLRPNSQLRIDEFNYAGKRDGSENSVISLLVGSMRSITGWIGASNHRNVSIKTPAATIGIRGSDGNIGYSPEIGASVQTLTGGYTISSNDASGNNHTLIINPGEVGLVSPGGLPVHVNSFPFATTANPPAATSSSSNSSGGGSGSSSGGGSGGGSANSTQGTDTANAAKDTGSSGGTTTGTDNTTSSATGSSGSTAPVVNPTITNNSGGVNGGGSNTGGGGNGGGNGGGTGGGGNTGTGPGNIVVIGESSGNSGGTSFDNSLVQSSQISWDKNKNLVGFTQTEGTSVIAGTVSLTGGTAVAPSPNTPVTDVTIGDWQNTSNNLSVSRGLSLNISANTAWATGVAGYYSGVLKDYKITGAINYTGQLLSKQDGNGNAMTVGTTGLSLALDLSNQTVNAKVDVATAGVDWVGTANNVPLLQQSGSTEGSGSTGSYFNYFKAGGISGGAPMTVTNNNSKQGTLSGSFEGAFTGQNFTGALLRFQFNDTAAPNGTVTGLAGFSNAAGFSTASAGSASTDYVGVTDNAQQFQQDIFWNSVGSNQWKLNNGNYTTFLNTSGLTNASTTNNGWQAGTWNAGLTTSGTQSPLDSGGTYSWGTITLASAWYLPAVLTGSYNYKLTQATIPVDTQGNTWTLNNAQVSVDFTHQLETSSVSLSQGGNTWVLAANGQALNGPNGAFHNGFYGTSATNSNTATGNLTVSYNGSTTLPNTFSYVSAELDGQLGGANSSNGTALTAALLGYNLQMGIFPNSTYPNGLTDSLAGTVALSLQTSVDTPAPLANTPYYPVAMAGSSSSLTTGVDGIGLTNANAAAGRYASTAQGIATRVDVYATTPPTGNNLTNGTNSGNLTAQTLSVDPNATLADAHTDSGTGLTWGRWTSTDGSSSLSDRTGSSNTSTALTTVHVITAAQTSGPIALPQSGTYQYTAIGNTLPTDINGSTGTLNTAKLSANFTSQLVSLDIKATVGNTAMEATSNNASLYQNLFLAGSGVGGTGKLAVSCSGSNCAPVNTGSVLGFFTNNGAGAGLSYSLNTSTAAGQLVNTLNGVVAFKH